MFSDYIKDDLKKYYDQLESSKIREIIKYSIDGGKCIRGFIVKHIMQTLSNNKINIWQPVACIELIHGISLVIDDLPQFDNDKTRRDKPSTFVKFGERQSILISFYAISEAFKVLYNGGNELQKITKVDSNKQIEFINTLVNDFHEFIGQNLIIGQMLDFKDNVEELLNFKIKLDYDNDKKLMIYKTCSLFTMAFVLGYIFSGKEINSDIEDFKQMGYYFGIMFQVMDDFNDKDTDSINSNYVLQNGYKESYSVYNEAKILLFELLKKHSINTKEINTMISLIDKKIEKKILYEN
jgi:farnesyl diphosphate synthase